MRARFRADTHGPTGRPEMDVHIPARAKETEQTASSFWNIQDQRHIPRATATGYEAEADQDRVLWRPRSEGAVTCDFRWSNHDHRLRSYFRLGLLGCPQFLYTPSKPPSQPGSSPQENAEQVPRSTIRLTFARLSIC